VRGLCGGLGRGRGTYWYALFVIAADDCLYLIEQAHQVLVPTTIDLRHIAFCEVVALNFEAVTIEADVVNCDKVQVLFSSGDAFCGDFICYVDNDGFHKILSKG
jgi:hypothetical protein